MSGTASNNYCFPFSLEFAIANYGGRELSYNYMIMSVQTFSAAEKAFLGNVMDKSGIIDIYDARNVTITVFRSLRDLMTTEAAEEAADEFSDERVALLWKDDNPIVAALSKLRPPLDIDTGMFLSRIRLEASLPEGVTPESAVKAVFSTAKSELSDERSSEIVTFLPNELKKMWAQA